MKEKAGQVRGQRVAGQGEQQALCCEVRQSLQQLGSRQELWLEWRLPGDQPWRALRNSDFILNQGLGHQRILSRGGTCSGFFFKRSLWLPGGDRLAKWARIEPGDPPVWNTRDVRGSDQADGCGGAEKGPGLGDTFY